jgi:hypothetical protein
MIVVNKNILLKYFLHIMNSRSRVKRCKKVCKSNKICNSRTGRCVLIKGRTGKKFIKSIKPKSCKKPCSYKKICNPLTGRCTVINSPSGKKVFKIFKYAPKKLSPKLSPKKSVRKSRTPKISTRSRLTSEQEFHNIMKYFDWWYDYADDPRIWKQGVMNKEKLRNLAKKIGKEKANQIYKSYATKAYLDYHGNDIYL